jgi:hypothetical protein
METYYRGTELKFKVTVTATGFSMADDDFEVEVKSGRSSITLEKEDLIVKSGEYFAVIDTNELPAGTLKLVATAHVPDTDADDGIRNEVAVTNLCQIVNP